MILVIGGAYQGKLDYARERFPDASVFQCTEQTTELDLSYDAFNSLHLLVLAQMRAGVDSLDYLEKRLPELAGKLLIADDISSGVVPVDPEMREWRERLGRCLGLVSRNADEVVRLFCGIPTQLK